jgi:hypothetical protein
MAQDFLKLYGPIKLARSMTDCWKCKKETPVAALIASDLEDVEDGKGQGKFGSPAYVYEVPEDGMPGVLKYPLQQLASQYKPIYSRTTRITQWANACVNCGMLQGAFFLHAEPDGPFFAGPENFSGDVKDIYTGDLAVQDASYSL